MGWREGGTGLGDTVHLSRSRVIETSHTQSEAGRQKIVTRKEEKTEEEGKKKKRKKEENGSGARGVALVLLFQFHIAPSVWNSLPSSLPDPAQSRFKTQLDIFFTELGDGTYNI